MSGREKASIAIVYLMQMALKGLGIVGRFVSAGYCDAYFLEESHDEHVQ